MKKKMTLQEFKDYYSGHTAKKISFLTENQSWYSVADPCKVQLNFSIMLIYENPNVIYLKCDCGNVVYFDRVRYIEIDTDATMLGTIITIFCGNKSNNASDEHHHSTYKLLAL